MRTTSIWYVYPFYKHVSFSIIGEIHCDLLKKYFRVNSVDELAFPFINITTHPLVIMHPYFYPIQKFEKKITRNLGRISGVIGVDVADSDHLTEYAVRLTRYANALIVPSNFARDAYIRSGVKKPVHAVPHGVPEEYFSLPTQGAKKFTDLAELKRKRNLKLLLTYIVHSPFRKGLDLLLQIYSKLLKEYNDVLLIVKTALGVGYFLESVEKIGAVLEHHMHGMVHHGWLTEEQKLELFDLCDIFLLTSRGGGFEHPPLEGLARGEVVIGAKGGAWEDFLPKWLLVPSKPSLPYMGDNPIHDGKGIEMDVDKAVDKLLDILNNLDDYKARVKEYVNTYVRKNLSWNVIGEKLRDVVAKYL